MIGMPVRNHGPVDRHPWIDEKLPRLAPQPLRLGEQPRLNRREALLCFDDTHLANIGCTTPRSKRCSGNNVWTQLIFKAGHLVFDGKLSLFQTLDMQLIGHGRSLKRRNLGVEIAMFST